MGEVVANSWTFASWKDFGQEIDQEDQGKKVFWILGKVENIPVLDVTWMTTTLIQKSGKSVE